MSKFIVLYNYNKYYNRIIKRLDTFAAYQALITPTGNENAQFKGFLREAKNFNFADGIFTQHVINIADNEPLFAKADQPDYFVLEESFKEGNSTTTKLSRWFVLESDRIRGNQYKLSLRRDLLADFYSEVLTAPVFIERGSPQLYDDPAVFNKEGFTFNQIKKSELLLNRNKLSGKGSGWVVGYIARQDEPDDIKDCNVKQEINLNVADYDDLPQKLKNVLTAGEAVLSEAGSAHVTFPIRRNSADMDVGYKDINFDIIDYNQIRNVTLTSTTSPTGAFLYFVRYNNTPILWPESTILDYFNEEIWGYQQVANAFDSYIASALSNEEIISQSLINQYNGTYFVRNGKYYKITFTQGSPETITKMIKGSQLSTQSDNVNSAMYQMLLSLLNRPDVDNNPLQNLEAYAAAISRTVYGYSVVAEEVDNTTFQVTIPKTRNQLLDAPYDMFVMPLGAVDVINGNTSFTTYLNTSLAAARGIAAKGAATILDVQILPYCPFPEVIDNNGNIDITIATEGKDYTIMSKIVGQDTVNLGIILYPLHSKGTFDYNLETANLFGLPQVDANYAKEHLSGSINLLEKKILSETSFVRFVSPNFSAVYEMDPQKNGADGALKLNIDYYYKPYTPYIHVMPILNDSMYGKDYNDPKGLICSGDFSLATASSKWEEYQIQNKNFQEQFDRQIQNLDVNNSIALDQMKITGKLGIATSALQGLAGGAVSGGFVGGGVGAVAGAAVGAIGSTVTSSIGYKKDIEFLKKQQTEARSYAVDMYTYQLGNIKALPNTLTRVSAFTPNNKIFPFVEIYDCTDEEKEALRNKIKYNGMTIMRIGHIQDYINRDVTYYVQGQLIRLEGIDEDSHVIAEIANEIKEGAYYYGSDTSES